MTYPCETYDKIYAHAESLGHHRATVHEGLTFRCEFCSHNARNRSELLQHQAFVHLKGTVVKCQICDKKFHRQCHLKAHMTVHTGDTPFSCSLCPKNFKHKWYMTSHDKKHAECSYLTMKIYSGENKCNECNFASSRAGDLRRHLKTHSGEKPNKCHQCDYASLRVSGLKRHLKTSPQAKRHKPSLLFTSLTILTFIAR